MTPATKEQLYHHWKRSRIITDERILSAFLQVPREKFVHSDAIALAYQDHPLPIGYNQTISQPTTVMLMIQLLEIEKTHKVLEIGAGSGYNAAIMSKLAKHVYTIETISELAVFAKNNITGSQITNVDVVYQDGKRGYKPAAPFQRIMVTAAASKVPEKLLSQLGNDGIMVIPVGNPYGCEMFKIHKLDQEIKTTKHGLFSFVPLV